MYPHGYISEVNISALLKGIHGAPFTDYGGVKALPDAETNGFCPHVSILFPTWHRPYLVFIEVRSDTSHGRAPAVHGMECF